MCDRRRVFDQRVLAVGLKLDEEIQIRWLVAATIVGLIAAGVIGYFSWT